MSGFSSDSDCFESADEEFQDENISSDDYLKLSGIKNECGGLFNPFFSEGDNQKCSGTKINKGCNTDNEVIYRKRRERRKNMLKSDSDYVKKISLNQQIFKSQIMKPDILVNDLTANLSKNLNRGINTIQQTSNSIKDLVLSSLPKKTSIDNTIKFSYDGDEEEQEEEEIASYLPESKEDCNENKSDEKTSNLSDKCAEDLVKLEDKEMEPCLQVSEDDKESAMEIKEELREEVDVSEARSPDSEISDEKCMPKKTIKNVLEDDIEEYEELKYFDETNAFFVKVKEVGQCVSDLKLSIKTEESQLKKKDEMENILKDDLEYSNEEIFNDNLDLKTAFAEENKKYTFHKNDGWDTFELPSEVEEEIGIINRSETCPIHKKFVDKSTMATETEYEDDKLSHCNEGWDDFDFDDDVEDDDDDDDEDDNDNDNSNNYNNHGDGGNNELSNATAESNPKPFEKSDINEICGSQVPDNNFKCETENDFDSDKWPGWDNFGEKQETKQKSGWTLSNWGVNALLNTATSVTQGLSTVLEAGLGAPDPETLAKMEMESVKDNCEKIIEQTENSSLTKSLEPTGSSIKLFSDFGITNLVAGVTKNIVEHTKVHEIGSKVISGGLDTLESFGKKTMEVLQEGDPGLKKKRALLLGTNKPTLSHALREAKVKAEMEDKKMAEQQKARLCHFETLFDDYQGLVYLEALEMLSRQCELKLEQMRETLSEKEVEEMNDTLDEVKELCIIDESEFKTNYCGIVDFKITLTKVTESLQNEISVQKIIQIHEECDLWFKSEKADVKSSVNLFEKAMSVLAELTAATVQQFHKAGELLSIKEHRKTVEEADALLQMTGVLCCEIDQITEKFLKLYTSEASDIEEGIENKIKEESANATSYIKDAFNLLLPVLQLGATM